MERVTVAMEERSQGWRRGTALGVSLLLFVMAVPEVSAKRSTKSHGTSTGHARTAAPAAGGIRPAAAAPPPAHPSMQSLMTRGRWLSPSRRGYVGRRGLSGRTSSVMGMDGRGLRVVDGDTVAYGAQRIRINGFDAPELSDPQGAAAKRRLAELLRGGDVMIERKAVDAYGRVVADVFVNGQNVGALLAQESRGAPYYIQP